MAKTYNVEINVEAIGAETVKTYLEKHASLIATLIRKQTHFTAGPLLNTSAPPVKPPIWIALPKEFIVGKGQIGDGYVFRFSDNKDAVPYLYAKAQRVEAGAEWMRLNAPRQWAAFCAARMLGRKEVDIVPENDYTDPVMCPIHLRPLRK